MTKLVWVVLVVNVVLAVLAGAVVWKLYFSRESQLVREMAGVLGSSSLPHTVEMPEDARTVGVPERLLALASQGPLVAALSATKNTATRAIGRAKAVHSLPPDTPYTYTVDYAYGLGSKPYRTRCTYSAQRTGEWESEHCVEV